MNEIAMPVACRTAGAIFCQRVIRSLDPSQNFNGIDRLDIAWDQRGQRTLRGGTRGGRQIRVLLPAGEFLDHGAVLVDEPELIIAAYLMESPALIVKADTPSELARLAYLVGNAHLPAEIGQNEIVIPATVPTAAALGQLKIDYRIEQRRIRVDPNGLPTIAVSPALVIRSGVRPPSQP